MSYQVMYMSDDGEYVTEGDHDTVANAWDAACDRGSRWIFFPYAFVVTESGKTVVDADDMLNQFIGKRVATVKAAFNKFFLESCAENAAEARCS